MTGGAHEASLPLSKSRDGIVCEDIVLAPAIPIVLPGHEEDLGAVDAYLTKTIEAPETPRRSRSRSRSSRATTPMGTPRTDTHHRHSETYGQSKAS